MPTLPAPKDRPQLSATAREQLLRHALTNAAAAIAGLLAEHPTANDARAVARAWLRTWEAYQIASRNAAGVLS